MAVRVTAIVVLAVVAVAAMAYAEVQYLLDGTPSDLLSVILVAVIVAAAASIYLLARTWPSTVQEREESPGQPRGNRD